MEVVIDVDTSRAVHEVSPGFLGVNIDMLALSTYAAGQPIPGGGTGTGSRLHFSDPQLRQLGRLIGTAAAAPTALRIGGGTADSMAWMRPANKGQTVVLDAAYWNEISSFVTSCGFELVWDLNAMGS
jgi:hypothetical protein